MAKSIIDTITGTTKAQRQKSAADGSKRDYADAVHRAADKYKWSDKDRASVLKNRKGTN